MRQVHSDLFGRQALGRSRGGFSTKLHALVTERGELLTGGQVNDITQGRTLVRRRALGLIGDRGYDSDSFIAHVASLGMPAIIPSRVHRKTPRPSVPKALYVRRSVVERWFGRLKVFRRLALSYLGFVAAAAWLIAITGWR